MRIHCQLPWQIAAMFYTSLPTGTVAHSNVIAQVLAEMDSADTYNQLEEYDGMPIQAVLTDGIHFEFYCASFKYWDVRRGMAKMEEGFPFMNATRLSLPASERAPDFLSKLKSITEAIFDTFIQAYITGIVSQRHHSIRRQRTSNERGVGAGFRRRYSTSFWDIAQRKANEAIDLLRKAHHHRIVNPMEADEFAVIGLKLLEESAMSIPNPELDWSLVDRWDDRGPSLMCV